MTEDFWVAYAPARDLPWNLSRVVHLHRRAAFAATWDELDRDLRDGCERAITRILNGTANLHSVKDYGTTVKLLTDAAVSQAEISRLKASWFYRFLLGPDPLLEKLTLLWHDHFATAFGKVADTDFMQQQNQTLRKHARGKFSELLNASVREPALLFYLDAQTNRKGHANENLGRELMELFTIGVGNYTESEVKEAARALTGWSLDEGKFVEIPEWHDTGEKTILGGKGNFDGSTLVENLLKHPAVADRIVLKLIRQFFGENRLPANAVKQLGDQLRDREFDIGWAVEKILRSRLFFDDSNLRTRVLTPVEYVVGTARALELFDPTLNTMALANWSALMGQDVFDPPNVGGWPVGRKWIHSRSLIARGNYAAAIVTGPKCGRAEGYDAVALPKKYGFGNTPANILAFHHRLLFGTDPNDAAVQRFSALEAPQMVTALLSSPEAQIG